MGREPIEIRPCVSPADVAVARELFLEYAAGLDFSLDYQGFDEELATLPGKYAPPPGTILLAFEGVGRAVGCVALRPLPAIAGACEMKRLYVRPGARGTGLGSRLAGAVVAAARALGYSQMLLDTSESMVAALRVYRRLGFTQTCPYNHDPNADTLYFAISLAAVGSPSPD